jgi:hypothetical protein
VTATPSKPNYAPFEANLDGAIAAANFLMTEQGYGIRDYPSNMAGLVAAILNLNIGQSNVGITPSQWMPIRDENGDITADSWDPPPANGTLWFDVRQGKLMVWINDGFYQANGTDRFSSVGSEIPEDPIQGQTWLDTDNYIYYIYDGSLWLALASMQGVETGAGSVGGAVSDAVIADLQQQIDNITIDVTPETITNLETQIFSLSDTTSTQIAALTQQIGAFDESAINAKLAELEAQINVQAGTLSTLETGLSDQGVRVTTVEGVADTNTAAITANEVDIATNTGGIAANAASIATASTDIATLQGQVTALTESTTSDFAAVNADVLTVSTDLEALQDQVTSLSDSTTADLGSINTNVATVTSDLSNLQGQVTSLSESTTAQIAAIQTQIGNTTDTQIAELQTQIDTQTHALTAAETAITDQGTRLTGVEGVAATNASDIATVTTDVTELQGQITTIDALLVSTVNEISSLRKIYYGDTAPAHADMQNGDLWVDSSQLRLLVRNLGAWFNPDRNQSPDDSAETLIINAVNNSTTFDEFKTFINANV